MHLSLGEHFTHSSLDEDDVGFVTAHRDACDLLAEVRPDYGDRRLGSQAIPFAIFQLIEKDVEEANNEEAKALFVEGFGDREAFFNVCVNELEKAEAIIDDNMGNIVAVDGDVHVEMNEGSQDIPEDREDKIKVLLDLFKEKDLVTLTKYIKIFTQGKTQILGIAHTKINQDFNKAFKSLNIVPDDDTIKHVKSFTKPASQEMSGKNSMVATVCKVFLLKNFSKEFRDMLLKLFSMESIEEDDNGEAFENDLASSQDYPEHAQSRSRDTLKICTCCKYKSRDDSEFGEHMKIHSKCTQCGLFFTNETTLNVHHEAFHAVHACDQCGKEVLKSNLKKHMNSHEITKGFKKVISKGKVKAKAVVTENDESEPKTTKLTGYRLFMQTKRPIIRNQNPDATPQEMVKLLNEAWNNEKLAGNKDVWDKKAKEFGKTDDNPFQECDICGLMIAKSTKKVHMERNHAIQVPAEQVVETVAPGPAEHDVVAPAPAEQEVVDVVHEPVPSTQDVETTEPVLAEEENIGTATAAPTFKTGDIVMVLRKTLHWPAKIISSNSNMFEIMIYDKSRTMEKKQVKYLQPFSTDPSVCDGRGAMWVKAWKEAKKTDES